jgi:hypothetical protein
MKKEVLALIERGAFRVMMRDELEPGANFLTGRFVLAVKATDTDREVWKARSHRSGLHVASLAHVTAEKFHSSMTSTRPSFWKGGDASRGRRLSTPLLQV